MGGRLATADSVHGLVLSTVCDQSAVCCVLLAMCYMVSSDYSPTDRRGKSTSTSPFHFNHRLFLLFIQILGRLVKVTVGA